MTVDVMMLMAPFTYSYGPNMAPALLKACLQKHGISTLAYDYTAEFNYKYGDLPEWDSVTAWFQSPEIKLTKQEFDWYQNIINDLAEHIVEINPKILGISLLSMHSQRFTEDLCYFVKKKNKEIKIIVGGGGHDIFQFEYGKNWNQVLIDGNIVDTAVVGEGEYEFVDVIKNDVVGVYRSKQLNNAELSEIPIPDYSDYDLSMYDTKKFNNTSNWDRSLDDSEDKPIVYQVTSSKGCVKNCVFCDVAKIWPKFRFRDGKKVAEEIIHLNKTMGANYFSFTDSLINGGLKPFKELNKTLAEELSNSIQYEAQFIARGPRDMPEEHFELMSRAGCYALNVGVESGSDSVRMHMKKGSTRKDVDYTTEMLTKYHIRQVWNIIVGYTTETDDDWQQTMDLVKYWIPRTNGLLTVMPVSVFLLLEGTHTSDQEYINENKIIRNSVHGYTGLDWISENNPTNTYERRAERFIELCDYLVGVNRNYENLLAKKLQLNTKRLEWIRNEELA
tara:strand:- start:1950 stop:3458 length:1509 start_codon:yes stop_codon:yes gene_type:complete